jgi:hypothetical protein
MHRKGRDPKEAAGTIFGADPHGGRLGKRQV